MSLETIAYGGPVAETAVGATESRKRRDSQRVEELMGIDREKRSRRDEAIRDAVEVIFNGFCEEIASLPWMESLPGHVSGVRRVDALSLRTSAFSPTLRSSSP